MHYPTIYVGTIVPYEGSKPSAIGKRQITGGVMLHRLGLDGDEQAEKKVHGGPIARCATIRANIIISGVSSIHNRQSSFAPLPWGKTSPLRA
jgi:hypothetical protein